MNNRFYFTTLLILHNFIADFHLLIIFRVLIQIIQTRKYLNHMTFDVKFYSVLILEFYINMTIDC